MEISVIQLFDLLSARRGAQIVTMVARTQPVLRGGKKSPLANWKVEKLAKVNGIVNWSYENAVNNQRMREGTPVDENNVVENFKSHPRSWGERINKTAFVSHVPKNTNEKRVYIEFKHQNSLEYRYYIDGKEADFAQVEPYLVGNTESSRQEVTKKVILRDYRLSSIELITLGGQQFEIKVTQKDEEKLYDILAEIKSDQ
jgi:hypothetical protein